MQDVSLIDNERDDEIDNQTKLQIKELDVDLISPKSQNDYNSSKIVIIGKAGTGKCVARDTLNLMYNGELVKVQDIKIGDLLMGDNSTPRKVLSLGSGRSEMYKISTEIADEFVVNSDHILCLKWDSNFNIITNENNYTIVWVDNSFKNNKVIFNSQKNAEIFKKMLKEHTNEIIEISVKEYLKLSSELQSRLRLYKVPIEFPHKTLFEDHYMIGFLLQQLAASSENKVTIPKEFKFNSRENRLKVLSGIIDSTCGRWISSNLEDDFKFLCLSLGYIVSNVNGLLQLSGPNLQDIKTNFKILTIERSNLELKFQIQSVGEDDFYGFELNENGRYLLGNFIVTHNTTIIKSLIYEKSHIVPVGMVFSGTEDSNHFWKSIFPDTFIFNGLDMDKLEAFVKRQRIAKEHLENPWAVILLDDVMDDPKLLNRPFFHGLFKNGRHWKLIFMLSAQYVLDLKPAIRTNIDCTFILRDPNYRNRKSLWENYCSIIPDFKTFCQILDCVTTDYCALVVMNNLQTNNWQDCVFYYKAKPVPTTFKFGCKEYWQYHKDKYNNEYKDFY